MGRRVPAPPTWKRTVTPKRDKFEKARRQTVLTLPKRILLELSNRAAKQATVESKEQASVLMYKSWWIASESRAMQDGVGKANLGVVKRLIHVMTAMITHKETKVMNSQQVLEVEVRLQKPGMIVVEQDNEWMKARWAVIAGWPRQHDFMESWRHLRGP